MVAAPDITDARSMTVRLAALAFLHDIGKANRGFQARSDPSAAQVGHIDELAWIFSGSREADPICAALIDALGLDRIAAWLPPGDPGLFDAAFAHHGRPWGLRRLGFGLTDVRNAAAHWRLTPDDPIARLGPMRVALDTWFGSAFEAAPVLPTAPAFQHIFAGLLMLADWLGSNPAESFFPFADGREPNRMAFALERARSVLRETGLDASRFRTGERRVGASFATAFADGRPSFEPRPIQRETAAAAAKILILESETGSGKTEAALWRFAELFRAGEVDGLYFALPTRVLAVRRAGAVPPGYAGEDGLALVWLRPWDGTVPLRQAELDPWYVEICRRVRLGDAGGRIAAQAGGSKAPRIVPVPGGVTGDPWAPLVQDKDGLKVLTVDAGGFGYRRMARLLFGQDSHVPSPLARVSAEDAAGGLTVLARALTRGQGKTEGLHERRVPVSNTVAAMLSNRRTDPLAAAATERVKLAGEIQNRVLKPALYALFENGPDQIDYRDSGAAARARDFLARFDRTVDATFFADLWRDFEPDASAADARASWVGRLVRDVAWPLIVEADRGMSKAVGRRRRALARAESLFWSAARRNRDLQPYWREAPRDDAA